MAASGEGTIYAVDAYGSLKWMLPLGEPIWQQGTNLGLDGTFHCVSERQTLFAVRSDGVLAWSLKDPNFSGSERSVLTMSPDGRSLYVLGMDSLTIPRPSLICLRPDGSVRWSFAHDNRFDQINAGDPTIELDGNVYFILDTLYSVGPDGGLRWKRGFGDPASYPAGDVPLLSDELGYIYAVVVTPNPTTRNTLYVFGQDGSIVRSFEFATGLRIDSSPAILWDGRMVVTGYKNQALYMLR